MNGFDKILLYKALQAASTVEEQVEEQTPVKVTTPGTKNLTAKEKNVKGDATTGDITINLPSSGISEFDTVSITKIDDSANTVTITGLSGDDRVLNYQYQSMIAMYDGAAWQIIEQILQPTTDKPEIHKGTSAPTDLEMLWYDIN